MIYIDNYFILVPLFKELQDLNYSAISIIRLYMSFPNSLVTLKDKYILKLEQNTLLAKVINQTLCLAWQDNNIILDISIVYITNSINSFQERQRRCLVKSSTNSRIIRKVFRDNLTQILRILTFIVEYNIYIGGVNIIN